MDSSDPEWLTPELVEELLFVDMEEDCESKLCKRTKPAPVSVPLSAVIDLVKEVDNGISQLSKYGEKEIHKWMENYAQYKDADFVVAEYGRQNCYALTFFIDVPESKAIKLLLQIVRQIVSQRQYEDELSGGEITSFENDTLEYLGGYTLKKAIAKFPETDFLKLLCRSAPRGSLIPLMKKRAGSLHCPSWEYLMFIRHVYLKFCYESSHSPSNIDFNKAVQQVLNGRYFRAFVDRVENLCDDVTEDNKIDVVITYVVNLLVRVLSHGFAKKLFSRMQKKHATVLSAGLRGDLKRQVH